MEEKGKSNLLEEISICSRFKYSLGANTPSLVMSSTKLLNLTNKEDETCYI